MHWKRIGKAHEACYKAGEAEPTAVKRVMPSAQSYKRTPRGQCCRCGKLITSDEGLSSADSSRGSSAVGARKARSTCSYCWEPMHAECECACKEKAVCRRRVELTQETFSFADEVREVRCVLLSASAVLPERIGEAATPRGRLGLRVGWRPPPPPLLQWCTEHATWVE